MIIIFYFKEKWIRLAAFKHKIEKKTMMVKETIISLK